MTNLERKQFVDEWHSGNENMAAFCRSKKLSYQTFRLWVKRFEEEAPPSTTKPPLVKLEIPAIPGPLKTGSSSIEIHIGQFRVIPSGSFKIENLERIIKVLKVFVD
ncbi:MAG: hypothetical protein KAH21_07270 [Spirochaetaceae bacterium]|nr:hypothetical protein [Spirochaetaceae bacterium]